MIKYRFQLLNKVILLLLVSAFFLTTEALAKEKLVKVSLSDLKKFAIKNNFGLKSLENKINLMESIRNKSRSKFYPKLGISAGIESNTRENNSETNGIGYLYGTYNIFNGMRDSLDKTLKSLDVENAEIDYKYEIFSLGKDVEIAYYQFTLFKSIYNLKMEELLLNKKHKNLVIKKRKAGQVSETDVMEFALKDAKLKSDLISIDQQLLEARIVLQRILGDEVGSNIEPENHLPHQHIAEDLSNLDDKLKQNSFQVLKLENQLTQNRVQSNLYKSGWLPKIDFEAKVGYLGELERSTNNSQKAEANLSILLKWDFFSGFETAYAKKEGNSRIKSFSFKVKQSIFDIISKLDIQVSRLKSIEMKVDLEKNNEKFGEKYYRSVLAEYKRGYKNSADLNEAAEKLFSIKEGKIRIIFSFLKEKISLEKAIGYEVKTKKGDH